METLSNPYHGLGGILCPMARTTTRCGYVVLSGGKRGRGGARRRRRFRPAAYIRARNRGQWWQLFGEV